MLTFFLINSCSHRSCLAMKSEEWRPNMASCLTWVKHGTQTEDNFESCKYRDIERKDRTITCVYISYIYICIYIQWQHIYKYILYNTNQNKPPTLPFYKEKTHNARRELSTNCFFSGYFHRAAPTSKVANSQTVMPTLQTWFGRMF